MGRKAFNLQDNSTTSFTTTKNLRCCVSRVLCLRYWKGAPLLVPRKVLHMQEICRGMVFSITASKKRLSKKKLMFNSMYRGSNVENTLARPYKQAHRQ